MSLIPAPFKLKSFAWPVIEETPNAQRPTSNVELTEGVDPTATNIAKSRRDLGEPVFRECM
jgi:hypothetical protein